MKIPQVLAVVTGLRNLTEDERKKKKKKRDSAQPSARRATMRVHNALKKHYKTMGLLLRNAHRPKGT